MPKRRALIIGIDKYDDDFPNLQAPLQDAENLARVLKDPSIGAFDEVQIELNESFATLYSKVGAFLESPLNRQDLLLLYFSGHGIRDDYGKLYLAAKNTDRRRLKSTAIPSSYIRNLMEESFSRRQVLILDCCHSGAVAKGGIGDSVGTKEAFLDKDIGRGRTIFTATNELQLAWEANKIIGGKVKNSLFTHYLVEGLETGKADLNNNGEITLDEWYS
jgi:uncharacterized caspase-like protein